jgi:hypothetical protein
MPSRINSTTTSPGGLISTGDSDNSLLIQTGDTTAITISSTQQVTLTNPLPVGSGGTGGTTGLTALNASSLTSGTVPDARFPATLPAVSGANLTSLNASSISSGTVGTARLASGTANNTTYLRGDQTWAAVQGGPNPLHGDQVFTSSGTFNVPTGVTAVFVTVIGAGGNGGANAGSCPFFPGGGGGAGGYVADYVAVTPGGTASVTVGTNGGSRTSSFAGGTTLTASGGNNGGNASNSVGSGNSGTSATASYLGLTYYTVGNVRFPNVSGYYESGNISFTGQQGYDKGQVYGHGYGAGGAFPNSAALGYGAGGGAGSGAGGNGLVVVEW